MAGLVPAIHVLGTVALQKAWMPGTRPGMTVDVANMATSLAPPRRRE
jgi:hypothetical protein